jgi:hypothetical protein
VSSNPAHNYNDPSKKSWLYMKNIGKYSSAGIHSTIRFLDTMIIVFNFLIEEFTKFTNTFTITTKVVSSNPAHEEVYSIQHYVIFLQYQNYLYIFFQSLIESLEGKAGKPRLKPPSSAGIHSTIRFLDTMIIVFNFLIEEFTKFTNTFTITLID